MSRVVPPPDVAGAGAGADAAGCDAGADASALGATEALAAALGIGVADGAGAYVQPGFALVQAATTRMAATATTDGRVRISPWTSSDGHWQRGSVRTLPSVVAV